jgi:6-phosphogluconate dehydrogenase
MIGLGRMGANMVRRLMRGGHRCVVYDRSAPAVEALVKEGATGSASLPEFVKKLDSPRAICLMVPAAYVDGSIAELEPLLQKGDTIIDGGNSHYHDDIARAKRLGAKGLHYVDMGTSGGVWGLERGYCLMIGLDLTAAAFLPDPGLKGFAGRVADSGEGRWTIAAAIDEAVPAHVLTASLYERFDSRGEADFQNRVLAAMRYGFGGHVEKK